MPQPHTTPPLGAREAHHCAQVAQIAPRQRRLGRRRRRRRDSSSARTGDPRHLIQMASSKDKIFESFTKISHEKPSDNGRDNGAHQRTTENDREPAGQAERNGQAERRGQAEPEAQTKHTSQTPRKKPTQQAKRKARATNKQQPNQQAKRKARARPKAHHTRDEEASVKAPAT